MPRLTPSVLLRWVLLAATSACTHTQSPSPASPSPGTSVLAESKPPPAVPVSPGDPVQGRFTIQQAEDAVPGEGELSAELHTSIGKIDCELWAERAPITVANFVGLALGIRPWRSEQGWVERPYFDGSLFHRVVPDFVIQGGRRVESLESGPGYAIPDETWEGARHDEMGLLCMANEGPNTGGSQFFIMADSSAPQLDGSYTIFGSCFQTDVVRAISRVKAFGEKPAENVWLEKVVITRAPRW